MNTVESQPTTYRLAFISGPPHRPNPHFDLDLDLDQRDYEMLLTAVNTIHRIGQREMYDLMARNFREIEARNSLYVKLFALGVGNQPISHTAIVSFMSSCINWLNSALLFLNHEEAWLKRTYGDQSSQFKSFKDATSRAYDGSVAYRFAYKLRNYSTHCGPPVTTVSVNRASADEIRAGVKQKIIFELNRDLLLSNFDWGSKVRSDLMAMDAQFELLPLIREATECLRQIMFEVSRIDIREAVGKIPIIDDWLRRMSPDRIGEPALVSLTPTSAGGYQVTPKPIPISAMDKLRAVDLSGDFLSSLILDEPELPRRPEMNPDNERSLARGAKILATRLTEGGNTPQVQSVIKQFISEDGSNVEPTMSALALVGLIMLHTSAMSMNISTESVIESFL